MIITTRLYNRVRSRACRNAGETVQKRDFRIRPTNDFGVMTLCTYVVDFIITSCTQPLAVIWVY